MKFAKIILAVGETPKSKDAVKRDKKDEKGVEKKLTPEDIFDSMIRHLAGRKARQETLRKRKNKVKKALTKSCRRGKI